MSQLRISSYEKKQKCVWKTFSITVEFVRMFNCSLPPALSAEWPLSFLCYYANGGGGLTWKCVPVCFCPIKVSILLTFFVFQSPVSLLIWFFFFSQRSRAASLSECLQQDTDVSEAVHQQCQWVVYISLSCLLLPFWTGVSRPVLQSWFHCSGVLAIALSFRYHYWLLLYSTLPCSWADSMRSCHMWLWMSLVFYGVFWVFTESVSKQSCLVVT